MSIDTSVENDSAVQVVEVVEQAESIEVVASAVKPSRRVSRTVRAAEASKSTDDASRQVDAPAVKTPTKKTAVGLSFDALRKLAVHAIAEGKSQSEVVEALIQTHLKKHWIATRKSVAANSADQATLEVSEAA